MKTSEILSVVKLSLAHTAEDTGLSSYIHQAAVQARDSATITVGEYVTAAQILLDLATGRAGNLYDYMDRVCGPYWCTFTPEHNAAYAQVCAAHHAWLDSLIAEYQAQDN